MNRVAIPWILLVSLLLFLPNCSRDPNVRKQKYLESGQRYFEKGKYREAAIQFSNAIQVDPRFGEAHYQLGRVYSRLQEWTPAYQEFTRSVDLQPDKFMARLDLASLLIAGREFKLAQEQIDWLLQNRSNDPVVHYTAGRLLAAEENLSAAMLELRKAVTLGPDRAQSYLMLASIQSKAGQIEAAAPNFRRAAELEPQNSEARLALAAYYQARGQVTESERELQAATDAIPNDPTLVSALVRLYVAEGKKDLAEHLLKQTKNEFTGNPAGYKLLGDFYFAAGDLNNATTEYASLVRQHPGDIVVKQNYAQLLILDNRFEDADKVSTELLQSSPQDSVALTYRGEIELNRAQAKEAIDSLQAALRSNPDNAAAFYQLGLAFDRTGDSPRAETAWRNAVNHNPDLTEAHLALATAALRHGDMEGLEQWASEMIRLLPRSPVGYSLRALSFSRKSNFQRAQSDAEQAISVAPSAPDGYLQMGNIRLAQKSYGEAAKFYRQVLELDAKSADALSGLMKAYLAEGEPQMALSAAQAQIAKIPDSSPFYDLLGTTLFDHRKAKSDLELAESELRKAVDLDQHNADAWLKLGQVQATRGAIDDAIATSQRALQDNPQQIEFYLLMGRLLEFKHELPQAQDCYRKALEINPNSPQASNNMASLLSQTGGNLDIALSLAQTARRQMPDSPNAADTLGWVLFQKGAYKSAIDSFQQALDLEKKSRSAENPTLHFHLGLAYEKSGQPSLARHHLEQVLKIDPHYSSADDVRKLLEQLRG